MQRTYRYQGGIGMNREVGIDLCTLIYIYFIHIGSMYKIDN